MEKEEEEDEDPFGAFGDDDDDDDDDDELAASVNTMAMASSLVEAANEKIVLPHDNVTTITTTTTTLAKTPGNDNDDVDLRHRQREDLSYLKTLDLTWPDPIYKGKILLVSSLPLGGGRGYVASETIPPGNLILIESPMMEWPEEQLGTKLGLVSVKHLLEISNASQLVHDIEDFHPTKEHVDSHHYIDDDTTDNKNYEQVSKMIQKLQLEYSSSSEVEEEIGTEERQQEQQQFQHDVVVLVEIAREKGICSRDGSTLTAIDILRLLLALRYNGLESGVYRHVAMLNHDDYPNCTKLLPTDGTSYSEVRTTRTVQAGETLTISYLSRVVSHASRRKVLWEQHRFDIGVSHLKGERYKMELIGNKLPPSPHYGGSAEQSLTDRIESATEELEKMQTEVEASIQLSPTVSPESYEIPKAMEQSVLELYNSSKEQLENVNHILLIPILSLHLEICATVIKDNSLSNTMQLGVLSRQTLSAYRLLPLQKSLLGADHFDIARTSLDLANAISELLSRSTKRLYELKLPSMNTFGAWSSFEQRTRKEHIRIKALYPHDAEQYTKP